MLSRTGPLPSGPTWAFELKWDGFRALVSTEDGLHVRSRRGWNMASVFPELRQLLQGLVLDGELVAWRGHQPYFPFVCRRVPNRDHSIPLTFVMFDLLQLNGTDLTGRTFSERRSLLASLDLNGPCWTTSETFDDGHALYTAVCEHGLEGVVAKKLNGRYRPSERDWVKIKNPAYWRRDDEREAMTRSRERRARSYVR